MNTRRVRLIVVASALALLVGCGPWTGTFESDSEILGFPATWSLTIKQRGPWAHDRDFTMTLETAEFTSVLVLDEDCAGALIAEDLIGEEAVAIFDDCEFTEYINGEAHLRTGRRSARRRP